MDLRALDSDGSIGRNVKAISVLAEGITVRYMYNISKDSRSYEGGQRTIVNGNSGNEDAGTTDGDAASRSVLDDEVGESTGVVDSEKGSGLGLASAGAFTILEK